MKKFLTICAVIIITAGSVWATDYYVRTDGNDSNTGLTNDAAGAWLTINKGTCSSSLLTSGDILHVADGIYNLSGRIYVQKAGITVSGNTTNPENVIVQYSPATNSLIFDMRASNVTIQGINVTGGKAGFWFNQSAVTGCTISNCIVDFIGEYGIYMKNGGSGHTIDLCTISNTGQTHAGAPAVLIENCLDVTFSNNTLSSISDKGVYVRVCNASSVANRVEVTGNTLSGCSYPCVQVFQSPYTYIYNNTISSTGDKGINIIGPNASSQAARVIVEGNSITGCPWGAILVTHDRYTYIYNNTIFSTDDKGITVGNGENVTSSAERIIVEGNNVSGTKWPGIQVAWAVPYTYIYNNTLSGCNYYGGDGTGDWDYASIHVDYNCGNTIADSNDISDGINGIQIWSDNCTVTNNTIYDMGLTYADTKGTADGTYYNSGIIIGSNWLTSNFKPTGTTITGNDIHDNYHGLYVRDYATLSPSDPSVLSVTAEKNWWGDASGPDGVGPGAGDAVSANVDYSPWWGGDYVGDDHSSAWTWGTDDNIQNAITVASSGDFINVVAGTYVAPAQIVINKNLTLSGAGNSLTTIEPGFNTTVGYYLISDALVYVAYGVTATIEDLAIDGTGYVVRHAIQSRGTDLTVKNCDIRDIYANIYYGRGIVFLTGTGLVENCTMSNIQRIGVHIRGAVEPSPPSVEVTGLTYTGKGIGDFLDYGIEVGGGGHGLITNCTITDCLGVASVDGSTSAGILVTDYFGTFTTAEIDACILTGNTDGLAVGYLVTDVSVVSIHNSTIAGNSSYGVYSTGPQVNALENWWGDQTGPSHSTNICGEGNAVSDYVDFIPWWCDETGSALGEPVSADAGHDVWIFESSTNTKLHASGVSCGGSYEWSPTDGLSDPNIPNPTVTYHEDLDYSSGSVFYIVTVKDVNGCAQDLTDFVEVTLLNDDWKCGKKNDKVLMCHLPEEPDEDEQTICISRNAIYAHIHQSPNDYFGNCVGKKSIINDELTSNPETFFVHAYPNPFKEACTIEVSITELTNARIQVIDLLGRNVGEIFEGNLDAGVHTFTWENVNIGETNSIYFLQVYTNKETKIIKLMTGQ